MLLNTNLRADFFVKLGLGLGLSALSFLPVQFASAQDRTVDLPLDGSRASGDSIAAALDAGWRLGRGARGEAVKELQRQLNELGADLVVDGVFGAGTENALRKLQREAALPTSGTVDEATFDALLSAVEGRVARANEEAARRAAGSSPSTGSSAGSAPAEVAARDTSSTGVAGTIAGEFGNAHSGHDYIIKALRGGGILSRGSDGQAVRQLQTLLKNLGYDVAVDGDYGPRTANAVKAFQRSNGLYADGKVGPKTFEALAGARPGSAAPAREPAAASSPSPSSSSSPTAAAGTTAERWLKIARDQIGVKEYSGSRNNPRIQEYHRAGGLGRNTPDSTAWCSSFMNYVMKQAGLGGTNLANARSWLDYGKRLSKPVPGAIVVFWRGSRNGWEGHVGIYMGETAGGIRVLGGNQSDGVNISTYPKSRVLGYRWPSGVPMPR